jgi:hypothetical protein
VAEPGALDGAKTKIENAIRELKDKDKAAILQAVDAAFDGGGEQPASDGGGGNEKRPFRLRFVAVFLFVLMSSYAVTTFYTDPYLLAMCYENNGVPKIFEVRTLLVFLGSIVALSSYLATVVRHIWGRLGEGSDKDRITQRRKDIAWIGTGEFQVVFIGILAIVRIFSGARLLPMSLPGRTLSFDGFLLTYMAGILLFLSFLHFRNWFYYTPWRLEKTATERKRHRWPFRW